MPGLGLNNKTVRRKWRIILHVSNELYMYVFIYIYIILYIYVHYYCSSVPLSKNMFDHFFLLAVFGSVKVEFPHRSLTLFSRQYGCCTTKYEGMVGQLTEMDDEMRNSKCQCIQNLLSTNVPAFPLSKCRRSHGVPLQVPAPPHHSAEVW